MAQLLLSLFQSLRPRQWLKNVALFATLIFSGHLFDAQLFRTTAWSFGAFCFLASSNYLLNDIRDREADRRHPIKRYRPIASGKVPYTVALTSTVVSAAIGLFLAWSISSPFFLVALSFLILQYSYTLMWKHIDLVDILAITGAYFLRVFAGEAATGYHISIWLALTAFSLSLFLAVGKRRAELTLVARQKLNPSETRSSLSKYSETLLHGFIVITAISTFLSYTYYAFLEHPPIIGSLFPAYRYFLLDFMQRKWMMLTVPFVLVGILRYMQLIYEGEGESPEKILTTDRLLLSTVVLWGSLIITIIYGIGSV